MGKFEIVDLLGWSAILLWIALSANFAFSLNGSAFQAVGVVGIAAGVGYFAMQRHATPHPYGALEIENLLSNRITLATDAGTRAMAVATILAKEMTTKAISRGEQTNETIANLSMIDDNHVAKMLARNPDNEIERQEEIHVEKLVANVLVLRARRNSEVLQAIVVVAGTLQSGLGGYLIDLIGKRVA